MKNVVTQDWQVHVVTWVMLYKVAITAGLLMINYMYLNFYGCYAYIKIWYVIIMGFVMVYPRHAVVLVESFTIINIIAVKLTLI